MAKIKFGLVVVEGRGKLGGHVMSKNRAGNYLRTKTTPVNPQTTYQTEVRGIFGGLASGWSALTEAQRDSFNARVSEYAKTDIFGDLKNPSGKALYQQLNQNRQLIGQTTLTTCPAPTATPFVDSPVITGSVGASEMEFSYDNDLTGVWTLVYSSGPVTPGTNFVKNKLRLLGYDAGANGASYSFWAEYVARFGTPTATQKIFFATRTINAGGSASPLQIFLATLTA